MCLIFLACDAHPRYQLILAANRDEFYDRPTELANFWQREPHLLAGRDLVHGGTWLGVTRGGRFSAITNYRDPSSRMGGAPSRGNIVREFLAADISVEDYRETLLQAGARYNGFNLLFGDVGQLHYHSNVTGMTTNLASGIFGLSNSLLDTPWQKVNRSKEALAQIISGGDEVSIEDIFEALADPTPAPDDLLPDTGIGLELERLVSPAFIESHNYGTRCSTVLLVERDNSVTMVERTFHRQEGKEATTVSYQFKVSPHSL